MPLGHPFAICLLLELPRVPATAPGIVGILCPSNSSYLMGRNATPFRNLPCTVSDVEPKDQFPNSPRRTTGRWRSGGTPIHDEIPILLIVAWRAVAR